MKKYPLGVLVLFSFVSAAYGEGVVFVQTNELENQIIVYQKNDDGTLSEVKRVPTTGKGTGEDRPLHNNEPGPDPLASDGSLIFEGEPGLLFSSNAGDNSVSVFKIGDDGVPTLLDREESKGDVVNSLAYHDASQTLYVGHLRGPNHIKVMDFENDDLVLREGSHSLETEKFKGRISSNIVLSHDEKFLLGNVLVDQKSDGSGVHGSSESNLVIFPVDEEGALADPLFHTLEGGKEPFSSVFLDSGENHFLTLFAETNTVVLQQLGEEGQVTQLSSANGDDSAVGGKPLEYCWVSLSPDQDYAYLSAFGTGDVSSFHIDGTEVSFTKGGIAKVDAGGDFTGAAGVPSSAPVDSWASEDGYFYQLYGAAGKLGAFKMTEDGGLEELTLYDIPVNSVQGITGY